VNQAIREGPRQRVTSRISIVIRLTVAMLELSSPRKVGRTDWSASGSECEGIGGRTPAIAGANVQTFVPHVGARPGSVLMLHRFGAPIEEAGRASQGGPPRQRLLASDRRLSRDELVNHAARSHWPGLLLAIAAYRRLRRAGVRAVSGTPSAGPG
jgi:hypothetical protein